MSHTTSKFFGGSTVMGGQIRKLNANTFREVVERYIHIPVQFSMTRREFLAMPKNERNTRKDGPYILACAFPFDEGHREDSTATEVNMVILDLDEGDFVKDFAESPDTLGEHLYPFAFTAWKTANHTDQAPRLKVAVGVEPCHPSNHRKFVKFIAKRLGLPSTFKGLRESLVLSQPQYRPIQFKGEDFNAVIASQPDGDLMDESLLLELDEELTEVVDGRSYAIAKTDITDEFFGLAHLPVPGLEIDHIQDALDSIDADCDYKTWVEVAAALRHQFTEEDDARRAYEAFDTWSAKGSKYRGESDTWSKWKSFRAYAKGRAPVTVRTLYKHATEAGWVNTKVAVRIKECVVAWMSECEDADVLMQEGAKRIAAMPFKNDVVEEAIILAWRDRIAALTKNRIDKLTLKKEISKVRRHDRNAKQDQRKELLPHWLQPICYIATSDVFHNFTTNVQLKPAAFDRYFEKELMPTDGSESPPNGRPVQAPSAYALNLMDIPRVDRTIYCPLHQGEDPFFELDGRRYLNTYDRLSIPVEDPEHSKRAGELFTELFSNMIEEEWLQALVLDYLALQVQQPGKKIPWIICVQSAEGVGKGYTGKIMAQVLGVGNVKVVSPDIIRSQWNDWMIGAQFYILEEIHFPGERREAVMNCLKPFITDSTIAINQRNMSARSEPNWSNAIAFTNFQDALHLKENDRRWNLIRSPIQTEEQVAKLNQTGIFDRLAWLLTQEGAGALRYWLKKRKIADDFPINGPAPKTKYRSAIVEESKNPLQILIEDVLNDGVDPMVTWEVLHMGRLNEILGRNLRDASRSAHYATLLGFERYANGKRFTIHGQRGTLWTHVRNWKNPMPADDYLASVMDRLSDNFAI